MRDQSGNVLVYILIAVGLLGALSYAMTQTAQQNMSGLTKDRAAMDATQVIEYGNILNNAVAQLRLRGVQETAISFQQNEDDEDYTNATCTQDRCKVFVKNGGGVNAYEPNSAWLDKKFNGETLYGDFYISGETAVTDVGGDDPELILFLPYIGKELCKAINKRLGLKLEDEDTPSQSEDFLGVSAYFAGEFPVEAEMTITGDGTRENDEILHGVTAGCLQYSADASYHYYQVLMAR